MTERAADERLRLRLGLAGLVVPRAPMPPLISGAARLTTNHPAVVLAASAWPHREGIGGLIRGLRPHTLRLTR